MRVLDLFSGIGGFSLGLERAGMSTVAFCEIEPYCRKVLAKHWPGVPIYGDVRELTADRLAADGIGVDVICGGFPCQDISVAGSGAGLAGERSGLWTEYARLVGELRPRFAIVENVAALLVRGMGRVLGDLAEIGYDAEWHCITAGYVGAPHRRDRIWIVAYPGRLGLKTRTQAESGDLHRQHRQTQKEVGERSLRDARTLANGAHGEMADPLGKRQQGSRESEQSSHPEAGAIGKAIDALDGCFLGEWCVEPAVGRVADGVPNRVERLRALGNAVVPQIPELIGRAIMNLEAA